MHKLAVFVSGTGRHLENFARLAQAGELPCQVGLVVSDKRGILALERAAKFDLAQLVLDPERELSNDAFSERAFAAVEEHGCDLVALAGFLRMLVVPERWAGSVLNIHPALLPAFGGKGYYGSRVHRAVLEKGCQFSGCTVHYVDNQYDNGPILLQRCVAVEPTDDEHSLAERVFAEEEIAFPEAIRRHYEARDAQGG